MQNEHVLKTTTVHSIEDFHGMVVNSVIEVLNILFAWLVLGALFLLLVCSVVVVGGFGVFFFFGGVLSFLFCCLIFVLFVFQAIRLSQLGWLN